MRSVRRLFPVLTFWSRRNTHLYLWAWKFLCQAGFFLSLEIQVKYHSWYDISSTFSCNLALGFPDNFVSIIRMVLFTWSLNCLHIPLSPSPVVMIVTMCETPTFGQGHVISSANLLNRPVCAEEKTKKVDKWLLSFSETGDSRVTWTSHDSRVFFPCVMKD